MKLPSAPLYGLLIRLVMGACDKGSWVPDAGKENYTAPANNTQIVFGASLEGPARLTIVKERKQSWTSTLGPSITYQDVLTLNPKFADYFNESITETTELDSPILVEEGQQSGFVGFTAHLRCSKGTTPYPFSII